MENVANLKRSIVLVGMMGCGKTAVGSRLAMELEVPFYDLDEEIEKNEKMTVAEIFSQKGEEFFRKCETDAIKDILNSKLCVLATGGGAYIREQNREIIKKLATCVYIRAEFEVLLERVSRKNTRPLLEAGDKAKILSDLMEIRCPIYEQADLIVDSTTGDHYEVVEQIIKGLKIE